MTSIRFSSLAVLARCIAALAIIAGRSSPALAQRCDSRATFSGPMTISTGGSYTGNWQSIDPSIPAVSINTSAPVTIINSHLRGPGDLVLTTQVGSNVTIRNSCFAGTNPNVTGQAKGNAVHAWRAASVLIEHNDLESVGNFGIFIQQYLGDYSPTNTIRIRYNRFHNVDARGSDGHGGYLTTQDSQNSHGIMLTNINGVPGIEIAWNQIINEPYQSGVGDSINIFDTSGTSASPIELHDNYVQGGCDSDPTNGDSFTYFGSAITTDGYFQTDPDLTTAFLKIHDNQAVGFGNLGMGVSIGHDVEMYANRVVCSGQSSNEASSTTSYALGILYQNYRNNPTGVFGNNSVHDNVAGVRRLTNHNWERADYAFNLTPTMSFNNVEWAPKDASAPTLADEGNEFVLWSQKLAANGVTVGSHFIGTTTAGDFDGDGQADITVYRPSTGVWYVLKSSTGFTAGAGYGWGESTDVPVPGDYDGDGKTDIAVYRPSTGVWYVVQSSTGTGFSYTWGASGDTPVVGDYDGDGKTDIAVYRPSTGVWYIVQSSTGNGYAYTWGAVGDIPLTGDYDGDGKTDIAVYRASTGVWYIVASSTGNGFAYTWGASGDVPVAGGDYDGDGKTDIAVFRPSTGVWYIVPSSTGNGFAYTWGASSDVPVVGDFDGDGKADIAVYRPSTGVWYIVASTTRNLVAYTWGIGGDIPILKR
jgi:hypothetical protein